MNAPVALITGGGSGIGLSVAEHLINQYGWRVAIVDIDAARAAQESTRISPHNCLGIHADVTDYAQQSQAFVQAFEWGGNRLDLVFLNAGIGDTDSMYKDLAIDERTSLPKPVDLRVLDVNLNAVIQGVHLARHFFSEKNNTQGGRIVITSSVLGLYPSHAIPLYSASKHGIVGLVRSCAPVYLKDKITINSLNPMLVHTNLMPEPVSSEFHTPEQTTPMSTILTAFDAIIADDKLTGQTIELAMDEVIFKQQPEYSHPNIKSVLGQWGMWERVVEPLLPRRPGENTEEVKLPAKLVIKSGAQR